MTTDLQTVGAMHQCKKGEPYSTCFYCGATAEKLNAPCPNYMQQVAQLTESIAPTAQAAPAAGAVAGPSVRKVFLVATGEEHEGEATYTRYDDAPPPLCDSECLYTAAPTQAAQADSVLKDTATGMAAEYQRWIDFFHKGNGDYNDFLRIELNHDAARKQGGKQ